MQKDYEELFSSVPCGILQMELPFGHRCQIYRINPKATQIMKVHLVGGDIIKPNDYLDEDNLKYAREIISKLEKPGDKSAFLLKTYHSAIEGEIEYIQMADGHELLQCMFFEVGREIELRRREASQKEVLKRVMDSVRCGIMRFTFEDTEQRITLVNTAAWKLLGFKKEKDCLHKSINDLLPRIHPEDRVTVMRNYCMLTRENDRNECEFRIEDGSGGYRRLNAVQQCLRDSTGKHLIQTTLVDITEQYRQMQLSKERDWQIIHSLGTAYFTIIQVDAHDDRYRVIKDDLHSTHLDPMGCYSEKLKKWIVVWSGKSTVTKELSGLSLEYFNKLYRQGKTSWEQDYSHKLEENNQVQYIRVIFLFSGDGKELDYITIAARDITELYNKEMSEKEALRAAYEASRQASRAKTEFLSNMSHDIRTPMNAISGFTQILERHLDSPVIVKENIEKIKKSSKMLLDLINNVLDVSRIESGKVVLDEKPLNLLELLEGLSDMIKPSIEKHDHCLKTDFKISQKIILGDATRIRQILMNLLSNAVKFTPNGGEISFSAWEEKEVSTKYKNIHFQVQDNGIGISKEFQKHIFEPFERAHETEEMQGTGLGMTITHNLIRLMNGMITISSEYGKGSCFDVVLPMKLVDENVTLQKEEEDGYFIPNWKEKHILVVEDNEINMEIICTFLEETGAKLDKANNGKEAVNLFEKSEQGYYDMILMDVQMPIMNGYEATKKIRHSSHLDARSIPIIAMTANAFAEDIYKAKQAGMSEHLSKPLELEKMYKVLGHWMADENIDNKGEIL